MVLRGGRAAVVYGHVPVTRHGPPPSPPPPYCLRGGIEGIGGGDWFFVENPSIYLSPSIYMG